MKNKYTCLVLVLYFLIFSSTYGQEFTFETKKIEINEIYTKAYDGKAISNDGDIEINGEIFEYNKNEKILKIKGNGLIFIKSKNTQISFEESIIDRLKQTIETKKNVELFDKNKGLKIKSDILFFDNKSNLIKSNTKTIIENKEQNKFYANNLFYEIEKDLLKVKDLIFEDKFNNEYSSNLAFIDLNTNKVFGKDLFIDLNTKNFENMEPRLKGNSVIVDENYSIIDKGVFTSCKRREGCPPWQLTAKKITHDKKRKVIDYEDAVLRLYDKPILYFPKFFHPDPTVKRQSGFLIPSFNSSSNSNYLNIPYFYAISNNKDFTLSPRIYSNNNLLVQTEYRQVNKDSKHLLDFSYFNENNDKSHLFYEFNKFLSFNNFDNSNLNLKIQQTSDDSYLKTSKINSNQIQDKNILENSINLNMYSSNTVVDFNATSYENLTKKDNDRYEFIMPKINILKNIENKTKLPGFITFNSESSVRNYNTNIIEKININDLKLQSDPFITKSGFFNDFSFIVKNTNTDSKNSKNFKKNGNMNISSLLQFNSTFPLKKNSKNYENIFTPKLSLKMAPNHTKNYSNDESVIDIDNVYSLNRISKNDTLEGGISLLYGSDYSIVNNIENSTLFNFKFANNLRLKENDDLSNLNQIGEKTSNFFTKTTIEPNKNLSFKYKNSIRNNLSEINNETFISEFKFKNFKNIFSYLNENESTNKNNYISNETSYNFDDSNQLIFSTRKNKKKDLTEFYKFIYQYRNDCLTASIEYNKEFYSDGALKPEKNIFFKISLIPFGQSSSPDLIN